MTKQSINIFGLFESYLFGIQESTGSLRVKAINWVMRVLMIVNYGYWIYDNIYLTIKEMKPLIDRSDSIGIALILQYEAHLVASMITYYVIIIKMSKINSIMKEIIAHLDENKKKTLKKINYSFSIIFSILVLSTIFDEMAHTLSNNSGISIMSVLFPTSYCITIYGPILRSILSYIYINHAISVSFPNFSTHIIKQTELSLIKVLYMKKLVKNHRRIREEINSKMGFIPLFICSLTFMYSIIHLTNFISKNGNVNADSDYWISYFTWLFVNIFMVIWLGFLTTDNDWYLQIVSWIIQDQEDVCTIKSISDLYLSQEKNALLNYLEILINSPIQHNACQLFLIDKKFLLNFIACLTPFCVMFIQLYQT